ncbi:MAG: zinc ribbon domain-containing protein [Desulfurococcales archaeon]|nr:zinc ribbon domain-containing protein [Desulfurococcales archaeon]
MARYIQCIVCGRMTPTDKGVCYHCKSPLPTKLELPEGLVVCPNCLRITPVEGGYCRHCKSPIPPSLVLAAEKRVRKFLTLYRLRHRPRNDGSSLATPYYGGEDFGMVAQADSSMQVEGGERDETYNDVLEGEHGIHPPRELVVRQPRGEGSVAIRILVPRVI